MRLYSGENYSPNTETYQKDLPTVTIKGKTLAQCLESAKRYGFKQPPTKTIQKGRRFALACFKMKRKPA